MPQPIVSVLDGLRTTKREKTTAGKKQARMKQRPQRKEHCLLGMGIQTSANHSRLGMCLRVSATFAALYGCTYNTRPEHGRPQAENSTERPAGMSGKPNLARYHPLPP